MAELWLIRHGQASFGTARYDCLSSTGQRQAQLLGTHFAAIHAPPIAQTGRLERQRHTAELAGAIAPHAVAGWDEYEFEGVMRAYFARIAHARPELGLSAPGLFQDPKRFQAFFEAAISHWLADDAPDAGVEPPESAESFRARVFAAMDAAAAEEHDLAVVTSGGVIAMALQRALGLNDATTFALNWRVANGSITRLHRGRRGWSLLGFNDISYLRLAQDPALITFR